MFDFKFSDRLFLKVIGVPLYQLSSQQQSDRYIYRTVREFVRGERSGRGRRESSTVPAYQRLVTVLLAASCCAAVCTYSVLLYTTYCTRYTAVLYATSRGSGYVVRCCPAFVAAPLRRTTLLYTSYCTGTVLLVGLVVLVGVITAAEAPGDGGGEREDTGRKREEKRERAVGEDDVRPAAAAAAGSHHLILHSQQPPEARWWCVLIMHDMFICSYILGKPLVPVYGGIFYIILQRHFVGKEQLMYNPLARLSRTIEPTQNDLRSEQ